jgi:rsbT co-antagonist protein RsbR
VTARPGAAHSASVSRVVSVLNESREEIIVEWIAAQGVQRSVSTSEVTAQCSEFMTLLTAALREGGDNTEGPAWGGPKEFLANLSRSRAYQGYSPSETATFVFSLKEAIFRRLRQSGHGDAAKLADDLWVVTVLIDSLGLYTTEVYQRGREEVILRQQQDMLELSTPVVTLWDGILALPLIGTLDSSRTQVVMETLLRRIVETGSTIAVLDITGVGTVDTLTAQHLLKTVTAARLMGAECIISGIRPQIAQTIVHLGVDLGDVVTKASLADAFRYALGRTGRIVTVTRG